jgi:hypothetical protein
MGSALEQMQSLVQSESTPVHTVNIGSSFNQDASNIFIDDILLWYMNSREKAQTVRYKHIYISFIAYYMFRLL